MTKVAGTTLLPALPTQSTSAWLQTQSDAQSAIQTLTNSWFEHRRKSAEALLQAIQAMSVCKDPAKLGAIQHAWAAGAFERIASECASIGDHAMKMTQSTAGLMVDAMNGHSTEPPPNRAA